jgi:hypothetical protein
MESYKDILNSKSIGLALSGGGSKGFGSCFGVLQFLDEKHQSQKLFLEQVLVCCFIFLGNHLKILAFKSIYTFHWSIYL